MGQGAGAASVEYLVHSPMIRSQYNDDKVTISNYGDDCWWWWWCSCVDYGHYGFGQILLDWTWYCPFCKIICVFEATMNKHIFIARCGFLTKDFEKSAFKWVQLGICGAENTKYDIFSICGHLQQAGLIKVLELRNGVPSRAMALWAEQGLGKQIWRAIESQREPETVKGSQRELQRLDIQV